MHHFDTEPSTPTENRFCKIEKIRIAAVKTDEIINIFVCRDLNTKTFFFSFFHNNKQ